jgi:succinoglycan biosynthesis transport protein ExoP
MAPVVPAEYAQNTLSWGQIVAVIRAHRRLSIIIVLAMIVATLAIVKLLPKSYTAQATILVNFESNDGTRQAPADLFTSYLLTQVELLRGRDVLLSTIDRLNLTKDPEFTDGYSDKFVGTLTDFVERKLRGALTVDQGKGIQLLYISATSEDRNKAALIANTVVAAYQARERDHSNDPTSGRAHEYSEQLNDLKAKVVAAEGRMAEFRQRTGITDIIAANDVETQALAALEQQLLQAQSLRRTAESKNIGDRDSTDQVMASQLIQNLKNQLSTLQAQLAELTSTLGPKHPKVLELQSQIAASRRSLANEIGVLSQNNSGAVNSAAQLEERSRRAVDEQRAKLVKIRALQDEGQKLQLELESAQTVYKRSLDNYDQVMFASSSLSSKAVPPLEPSKPNKPVLAAVGFLLAMLFGVAGPAGFELLFNRRLHCRDDIERELGLPVLAEFDRIAALPSLT